MKNLAHEFKQFIMRGNVVDLAIAVVIGAAFGGIVTAFVEDLITPLIAAVGGQHDFSAWYFTINSSTFKIGDLVNKIVSFLIIAAVVFFLVVKPLNFALGLRRHEEKEAAPTTQECPYCLSKIPLKASRCAFCTQEVPTLAEVAARVNG